MMDAKVCTKCAEEKPVDAFLERTTRGKKLRISRCRQCMSRIHQEWAQSKGKEVLKVYSQANHDKALQAKRKYRQSEKGKETHRCYAMRRYETCYGRIISNVSCRVRRALKAQGQKKEQQSLQYIGCSVSHLRKHIEDQFLPGMSWEGRRAWHMDHIIPLASFDLSIEEERHRAFHYTNIQPLFAKDNLAKSSFLPNGERARRTLPVQNQPVPGP